MLYHSIRTGCFTAILFGLVGCRASFHETEQPIQFSIPTSAQSKTETLAPGDPIRVFATVEGTETLFLDNVAFVVGSDGTTLSTTPTVYYPEVKQAVSFFAYFGGKWDGGRGTCSVPTDQSTPAARKQADLCWATTKSTPIAVVPLEFRHVLARLVIQTNTPTTNISVPNIFSGGTFDIKKGAFTNTTKSDISTTGTELILPAQTASRLVLTVSGVEYLFEQNITLESGKTTLLDLTLNASTQTATLSGSSTTEWGSVTTAGIPLHGVTNTLTLHWAPVFGRAAETTSIVLSIKNETTGETKTHSISEHLTFIDNIWSFPFVAPSLSFPYTIQKISLMKNTELMTSSERIVGGTVYKSGAYTVGINGIPIDITINGLRWATGCLVATNQTAGTYGPGNCTIGAPYEPGLLFAYGSLIGYATSTGSSGGRAIGPLPFVQWIRPPGCTLGTGFLPTQLSSHIPATDNPVNASGDPCRYYLGAPWRTPTPTEAGALLNLPDINNLGWRLWSSVSNARWVDNGPMEGKTSGVWVGPNAKSGRPTFSTDLFFAGVSSISGLTTRPSNDIIYPWLSQWYWGGDLNLPRCIRFNKNEGVVPADVAGASSASPVRCVRSL